MSLASEYVGEMTMTGELFDDDVQAAVRLALEEDLGIGDATTLATVPKEAMATAVMRAREEMVVCGVPLFGATPDELADVAARQRDRLALLPARVRTRAQPVSDDF